MATNLLYSSAAPASLSDGSLRKKYQSIRWTLLRSLKEARSVAFWLATVSLRWEAEVSFLVGVLLKEVPFEAVVAKLSATP